MTTPVDRPVTRDDLARLVDRFYADVFHDAELGPLFAPLSGPRWPEHRRRMTEFWCTTLLRTRSYRGNVLARHQALLPALQPPHFARWLALWRRHTAEQMPAAQADELYATARGIARNLHLGCFGTLPSPAPEGA